jgi:hypothetical protein
LFATSKAKLRENSRLEGQLQAAQKGKKLKQPADQSEGSSIRWQAIAIEQLGYAVGLFLSFSTAALGFLLTLIENPSYNPDSWTMRCMDGAGVGLIASLVLGGVCVVNRLQDFRKTREIARQREEFQAEGRSREQIQSHMSGMRAQSSRLGERTWLLFWMQIVTFAIGALLLVIGFALSNRTRLF